jgi:osmotically-inducible protein OsmY
MEECELQRTALAPERNWNVSCVRFEPLALVASQEDAMGFGKHDRATDTANSGTARDPYVPQGHGRTDEQIRADVHELLTTRAHGVTNLSLSVIDGVVTLRGEVDSSAQQQYASELIRDVPSVRRVENRLTVTGPS